MLNNLNARLMAAAGKCFGETDKRQQINNALARDASNWNWNRVQCAISPMLKGKKGGKRKVDGKREGELADNDSH